MSSAYYDQRMPTARLLIQCTAPDACDVAFEPWGSVEILRPDDAFTVEITGPGDGLVEIALSSDGLSVFAWIDDDGTIADMTAWNKAGERLRI